MPVMLLKGSALDGNIKLMADYCAERGLQLAPHVKTALAANIARRQFDAGAWGVTVASVPHAKRAIRWGVARILIANVVVEAGAIAWLGRQLLREPTVEIYCYVDSIACVDLLETGLSDLGTNWPLPFLVELGVAGGRTGCRSIEEAERVAHAVAASTSLRLAGTAGYEGIIDAGTMPASLRAVDAFLDDLRALTVRLVSSGRFPGPRQVVISAGGSEFFDRVADRLGGKWAIDRETAAVLRSGGYVAHDETKFRRVSPLDGRREPRTRRLRSALELWGAVLSRPEPGLAIVGIGKRDAPYDVELPEPRLGMTFRTGPTPERGVMRRSPEFARTGVAKTREIRSSAAHPARALPAPRRPARLPGEPVIMPRATGPPELAGGAESA